MLIKEELIRTRHDHMQKEFNINDDDLKKNISFTDYLGNTVIHIAAMLNHMPAMEHFLKCPQRPSLLAVEKIFGNTPLLWGIANSSIDCVMLLLSSKSIAEEELRAQINQADRLKKNTPLILTSAKGLEHKDTLRKSNRTQSEVFFRLLELGVAAVDAKNSLGLTALHYACLHRNSQAINALVNHGANLNAKDFDGVTPLDMMRFDAVIVDAILKNSTGESDTFTRNDALWKQALDCPILKPVITKTNHGKKNKTETNRTLVKKKKSSTSTSISISISTSTSSRFFYDSRRRHVLADKTDKTDKVEDTLEDQPKKQLEDDHEDYRTQKKVKK